MTVLAGDWGTRIEIQRRRRIAVAVWAYAYEIEDDPLVEDHVFDDWARMIDPSVSTGHARCDKFFATEFSPHTGSWVHRHPHTAQLAELAAGMRRAGRSYGFRIGGAATAPAKAAAHPAQGALF